MPRFFAVSGCLFAFVWVALSAIAAHALQLDDVARGRLVNALGMLMPHALALILLGHQQSIKHLPIRMFAGLALWIGVLLFSGTLCWRALGGGPWLSAVAPWGGSLLMFGWALWGLSLLKKGAPGR